MKHGFNVKGPVFAEKITGTHAELGRELYGVSDKGLGQVLVGVGVNNSHAALSIKAKPLVGTKKIISQDPCDTRDDVSGTVEDEGGSEFEDEIKVALQANLPGGFFRIQDPNEAQVGLPVIKIGSRTVLDDGRVKNTRDQLHRESVFQDQIHEGCGLPMAWLVRPSGGIES